TAYVDGLETARGYFHVNPSSQNGVSEIVPTTSTTRMKVEDIDGEIWFDTGTVKPCAGVIAAASMTAQLDVTCAEGVATFALGIDNVAAPHDVAIVTSFDGQPEQSTTVNVDGHFDHVDTRAYPTFGTVRVDVLGTTVFDSGSVAAVDNQDCGYPTPQLPAIDLDVTAHCFDSKMVYLATVSTTSYTGELDLLIGIVNSPAATHQITVAPGQPWVQMAIAPSNEGVMVEVRDDLHRVVASHPAPAAMACEPVAAPQVETTISLDCSDGAPQLHMLAANNGADSVGIGFERWMGPIGTFSGQVLVAGESLEVTEPAATGTHTEAVITLTDQGVTIAVLDLLVADAPVCSPPVTTTPVTTTPVTTTPVTTTPGSTVPAGTTPTTGPTNPTTTNPNTPDTTDPNTTTSGVPTPGTPSTVVEFQPMPAFDGSPTATLPATGGSSGWLMTVAGLALVAGWLLVASARRRI
ncbi:MAG TPA: LPXTG cell wall anchor domain-containing protein, partial [Ilumatobacter sp.]|nr:LPXTG cell wall anchor domain-containing protein [Ilumatobacter sp.]